MKDDSFGAAAPALRRAEPLAARGSDVGARAQLLSLEAFGQRVEIHVADDRAREVLHANFGALIASGVSSSPGRSFEVRRLDADSFLLHGTNGHTREVRGLAGVIHAVEKALIIHLQLSRPDLLFLHAAVVERHGRAFLLAADTGRGKSTTTWGLLHHGCGYASDELAPVELEPLDVHPYPHALCLKRRPPTFPLPAQALDLGRTIHVPASALPASVVAKPLPLGGVFFVSHMPGRTSPSVRRVGPAEGAARLYVTALNALAHPDAGLGAVVRVTERLPCYVLEAGPLPGTCAAVLDAISQTGPC